MSQEGLHYKPKIFKQGLVLVLLPLTVGTCMLLLMSQLWQGAEKLARAEEKQTEILAHFNFAFNLWGQATANLIAKAFASGEEGYQKKSEEFIAGLQAEFKHVLELSADNKKSFSNARKLESLCMGSLDEFSHLPSDMSSDPLTNFQTLQELPVIFQKLYMSPGKIRQPMESEWKRLQAVRQKEDDRNRLTKLLVYVCIFGNLIFAFVLVRFFAGSITKRLRIVTENAALLPQGQPLTQSVAGNDELAYLDSALQDASTKLIAAGEHRRTVLGMVAHDMRSPLLAAQLCLQVLSELLGTAIEKETEEQLNFALSKMHSILEHVAQILKVEKSKVSDDVEDGSDETAPVAAASAGTEVSLQSGSRLTAASKFVTDMFARPKIFHKGLWLVLIPLLLQSVLLLMVNQQIVATEKIIERERIQSNIAMIASRVYLDSLKATIGESVYMISQKKDMKELVLRNFQTALDGFEQIIHAASKSPDWLEIMTVWKDLTDIHVQEMGTREDLKPGASLKQIIARFKEYRPMQQKVAALADRATRLYKKDSLDINDLQEQQRDLGKTVSSLLTWGIVLNFLVGLAMLSSFSNDIKERINFLVKNADRLGDNKPIEKLISGTDELAYLDLIFHHAQEQLTQAAAERAAMMSMLAREMAEPLKQAQQALVLIEEKEKGKLTEKQQKQLTRAQLNIQRVLRLIDDLLTMETLETGKITLEPTSFNLQSLADESIATVASLAAAKQINIVNQCPDVSLHADKARLIQTLINFLSNAVKFSPEKSNIAIIASEQAGAFRIAVKDEGPGMDEHTKNHVFEKFFQAEGPSKQQGFGLGLAICRMIVESHGGQIGVESAPGQGSTFYFDLPLTRVLRPDKV